MQSPLTQWDNAADWYDQNMGERGDALNKGILRPLILDMLGDLRTKTVLDVGCGSGYLSAEIAEVAEKVVGTDFSENFISICKEKYNDRANLDFMKQDVTDTFSFDDASFDVMTCKMVLQYVPEIHTFAREAARLLKDNGTLIVIVDHPFRAAYFNAQQEDGPEPNLFSPAPKTKTGLWGRTELTWYARTTSQYIQTFIDSGLNLSEIREPLQPVDHSNPVGFSVLALKFSK